MSLREPISGNRGCSPESLSRSFWRHVEKGSHDECWEWHGPRKAKGYGTTNAKAEDGTQVTWIASRLSYVIHYVCIPPGMHILHKCHNPPCVNPGHLRVGSNRENQIDIVSSGGHHEARKTHCRRGHEYTAGNTYIRPNGHRVCRTCQRTNGRRAYANKRKRETTCDS